MGTLWREDKWILRMLMNLIFKVGLQKQFLHRHCCNFSFPPFLQISIDSLIVLSCHNLRFSFAIRGLNHDKVDIILKILSVWIRSLVRYKQEMWTLFPVFLRIQVLQTALLMGLRHKHECYKEMLLYSVPWCVNCCPRISFYVRQYLESRCLSSFNQMWACRANFLNSVGNNKNSMSRGRSL